MICWTGDDPRFFYVRVSDSSLVRAGEVTVVRSDKVINQTVVDRC